MRGRCRLGVRGSKLESALYPRVGRGVLCLEPLILSGAVGTSGTATAAATDNECT